MRLKRLVIVCFEDPRRVSGGVQRRVAAEVDYFAKHGVEVTVITEGQGDQVHAANVRYITVPTPTILYPVRALIFAARVSQQVQRLSTFDILETHHDAGAVALFASLVRRRWPGVFVEVIHGVFRDEFAAVRRYEGLFSRSTLVASGLLPLSLVEQLAARRATAVIAVSHYAAEQIARHYRVPRERIHVITNGICVDRYTPATRQAVTSDLCSLVYVGRWHARKGVLQLLRAFALAHGHNPNLRLKFVGGGPLETVMREECVRLKLTDVVELVGGLPDEQVVEAYRSADIVCIPSLQEGQGIVALEAQACGAPVIATRAGGLAEVVKDQLTGLLVPPGDIEALAGAILALSGSRPLQQEFGRQASEWARSFAWEKVLSGQLSLYEGLLRGVPEPQG